MHETQVVTIVTYLAVPIVTAVVGVLGVSFQDWRSHRTQVGRRKLALEDARLQVSFATEWWNANKLIGESADAVKEATALAMKWLEEASERVVFSELPAVGERPRITFRRLLLLYPMGGRAAKVVRAIFYVFLTYLILGASVTIGDALGKGHAYVFADLIQLIIVALITLVLRFWAASTQRSKQQVVAG